MRLLLSQRGSEGRVTWCYLPSGFPNISIEESLKTVKTDKCSWGWGWG